MSATGSFVPLPVGASSEGEKAAVFRAYVVKSPTDDSFQSLASLLPPPAGSTSSPGPQIELERKGRTITRIRIHCTCGQVHELECRYDSAS